MRRPYVASTSFRRRVPIRFLINQCQIITFLILKYDIIENSRIKLRGIVLPVQIGGLLGVGGGAKGMLAPPPSQIIGGGPGPPCPPPPPPPSPPPPSSYAYASNKNCNSYVSLYRKWARQKLYVLGHLSTSYFFIPII